MNNKLLFSSLILIIAPLFFGCSGPAKRDTKSTASSNPVSLHDGNEKYAVIDTKESVVTWKGANTFGTHTGYVSISKGELIIENGELKGGAVEVDMTTIEDESHRSDNNLIDHLKNPDFFDVTKFPSAAITLTSVVSTNVEDKEITGNLTIKGITHSVSFPAKMEVKDGMMKVTCKLVIDRTRWGIRYGSGKFFDNLKDETISDNIEFGISVVAKNKG